MSTQTAEQFINEKKENFCNYLLKQFPKCQKVKNDIDLYRSTNSVDFLVYIKENIQIYETDLHKFVDTKFSEYFKNGETLSKEVHEKLVRYLQMFIDFSRC